MKIIILGAGQVGSNLAAAWCAKATTSPWSMSTPTSWPPCRTASICAPCCGQASHPSVLRQAGADDADMLVAVTLNDETNMVACKLAGTLFNIPTKIARIRSHRLHEAPELFDAGAFRRRSRHRPEKEITDYMRRLIDYPEALQVVDFADGRIRLVAVRAPGGFLVGHELKCATTCAHLRAEKHLPALDARVAAIFRRDRAIVPEGNTMIQDGDEVFFIAATEISAR
jgi:trk system potassium uptake protein